MPPTLRLLAIGGAAAGIVLLLCACSPSNSTSAVSPSPSNGAPSRPPTPVGLPATPSPITVAAAATLIKATVTGAHPVLLPSTIPSNWPAVVTNLSASFFTVTYMSPDGTQEVDFAIEVPNPGPPGPHGSQSNPAFHGDLMSLYQVEDTTQATTPRFLMWNEPGTWSEPNGRPGVPYVLSTTGFSDAEFWSIANSLQA